MKADYTTILKGARFQVTARAGFPLLTGGGRWLTADVHRPVRNVVASCVNDSRGTGAILSIRDEASYAFPSAVVNSEEIARYRVERAAGTRIAFVVTCRRAGRFVLTSE